MQKQIKRINFVNDPLLTPDIKVLLEKYFEVIIDNENPDFVFCGPYVVGPKKDNPYKFPNAVKIFLTGEAVAPDFNIYDYALGFDELDYGDRYLRCPYWALSISNENLQKLIDRQVTRFEDLDKKNKFCNFIYSNHNGHKMRREIFEKLEQYKRVDSWGRWLNNMGEFAKDKIQVIKDYKFSVASENAWYPGYTTEKLIDAYLGNTLPIYWGNPDVVKEFNESSFINVFDFKDLDALLDEVKKIDNNDALYLKYLNQAIFKVDPFIHKRNFEKFILNIVSQTKEQAVRKGVGMFPDRVTRIYNESWNATHPQKNFWKMIFDIRANRSVIYIQILGIKIEFNSLFYFLQNLLEKAFVIRFKRFHTQVRLFGIDFINKLH